MTLLGGAIPLTPRDRRALYRGAWLVVPLLLAALVVRPYVRTRVDTRAALMNERMLLAKESGAVIDLPRDRATLDSLAALLAGVSTRLFGGSDAVTASAELARYVSIAASECGLRLEQVETDTDSSGSGALRVLMRARGDVVAIHAFFRAMERGSKLVGIQRVEIARGSELDAFDGVLTLTAVVTGHARSAIIPPTQTDDEGSP